MSSTAKLLGLCLMVTSPPVLFAQQPVSPVPVSPVIEQAQPDRELDREKPGSTSPDSTRSPGSPGHSQHSFFEPELGSYQAGDDHQKATSSSEIPEAANESQGKPTSARAPRNSLPLRLEKGSEQKSKHRRSALPSLFTVVGSLAVVLGLFFLVVWFMRRAAPKGLAPLPQEVFESLGRAPLATRQNVHLVRFGNKLLLVAVGSDEVKTLTEITDPDEVNRLAGICYQNHPNSATATFRKILDQFSKDRPKSGFEEESHATAEAPGQSNHGASASTLKGVDSSHQDLYSQANSVDA